MNEEYLWNKTGGDAEIESLENALKAFSYKQSAPPQLPGKNLTLVEKPWRSYFRLGFALAFASAVVVTLSVTWFLVPRTNVVVSDDSVNVIEPQPVVLPPADVELAPSVKLPMRNDSPVLLKARHTVRPTAKRINTIAVKKEDKARRVNLTEEEKYAYGQLMLALSITESKLKIVRDTIAGNEERKTIVEKEKNLYQK